MQLNGRIRMVRSVRRGVTLVEMLVGIGITVLLIALIFPGLKRSMETANGARCVSNLRQLASLFNMYAQEKGRYPQIYRVGSSGHWYYNADFLALMNTTDAEVWAGRVKVYLCPADKDGNKNISIDGKTRFLSYGANIMLGTGESDVDTSPNYRAIAPPRVSAPSKLIMLLDARNFFFSPADNGASAVSFRHGGRLHAAFTDGHVESREEIDSDPSLLWPDGVPH